jgi:hypothetical protein
VGAAERADAAASSGVTYPLCSGVTMIDYVIYERIAEVRVDRAGNLRLFRMRRLIGPLSWFSQDVFHPAGQWGHVELEPDGGCEVTVLTGRRR